MFIWTSGRSSTSYRHDEKRNIYQKIRDHDLLDKRKTVTALKAGEDRAILLGLAMMVCSIMMYFLLGITLLRSYMQSVWTEEAQCSLLNASITESFNCSFSCGPDCWKISQYPCLQVYVNLTSSGQKLLLYHNEETMKINSETLKQKHISQKNSFLCFNNHETQRDSAQVGRRQLPPGGCGEGSGCTAGIPPATKARLAGCPLPTTTSLPLQHLGTEVCRLQ
uniref:Calcium-activated potassium channel subunit beta-2 n=1 Tax=Anas platyrhynchos platyrhynchos TaxID=8840 RepID=A0A493SUF1_ANAPP